MKRLLSVIGLALLLSGCASVYTNTRPYLGVASYAPTQPEKVQILAAEPKDRHHERLGEIFLDISGSPSRERVEKKVRKAAAAMGADAAFIVSDKTHIFPAYYWDWWGGSVSQDYHRGIVAVAIKYK
jgi:hypothetical protein